MPPTKIDHKELQRRLKEDEVAVFLKDFRNKARWIFQEYGNQTITIVLIVAVVFLAGYFWKLKNSGDFAESQRLYANAIAFVQKNQYVQAINELSTLIDTYGSSKITTMGRILRGNCYAESGDYTLALNDYQQVVPSLKGEDELVVRFAIVQSLRSLNRTDDALKELSLLEKKAVAPIMKEQILFLQGCCYEDKNNTSQALESFKAIPATSKWYSLAADRIQWLQAEAATPVNP